MKKLHQLIIDLEDFDIDTHLIWVKAHNNEIGNEIADDMAKAGMFNIYRSMEWNEVEKEYSEQEWNSYSYKAIKKENKRKSFYNTLNDWKTYWPSFRQKAAQVYGMPLLANWCLVQESPRHPPDMTK